MICRIDFAVKSKKILSTRDAIRHSAKADRKDFWQKYGVKLV
jgi:hypothetical protein